MQRRPTDAELKRLIVENTDCVFTKLAMVAARSMRAAGNRNLSFVDEQFDRCVQSLIERGIIESVGDVKRWRYSEMRLCRPSHYWNNRGSREAS